MDRTSQKLQQARGAAVTSVSQSTIDTGLKRQEEYFVCKADSTCSGDSHPDLWIVEDTAPGAMHTMKEVLQVEVGTEEKTYSDRTVQWEQRSRDRAVQWEQRTRELEAMSRGILPYIFKAHSCIMHAASVKILAVGWKWVQSRLGQSQWQLRP